MNSYLSDNVNFNTSNSNGKSENFICDFKNVCLKENVHLKRDKKSEIYSLQFYLDNPKYNLYNIINLNMYNLLYELNQDNFEKIEIKNWLSNSEVDVLFLFKQFGKDLGIKPKYMYIRATEIVENGKKTYNGYDIEYPYPDELTNYEKVTTRISTMVVNFESNHKININYLFKLDLAHSLPIYMENVLGLIMKKMFLHLKQFIETINH
jgi:hypothetical protein